MSFQLLTLKSIRARPVVLKLRRPVAARIATLTDWPLILIDLYTEEGEIGRSYLEPYIPKSMRYLITALHDLGEMLKGRRLAPLETYEAGRKSSEASHAVSLCDMHAKYADIVSTAEILAYFDQLPAELFDLPAGVRTATQIKDAAE